MATNNSENINFKITNLNDNRANRHNKKKTKRVLRPPTLKFIFDTIDNKDFDPLVKEELKKSAADFPHHALHFWIENYEKFLAKAKRDVRDRIITESNAKNETVNSILLPELEDSESEVEEDFSSENQDNSFPDSYDPTA